MNSCIDIKPANTTVEFLGSKGVYALDIRDNVLHITCLKKLNSLDPRALSSLSHTIRLRDVISVTDGASERRVSSKVVSIKSAELGSVLNAPANVCHVMKISFMQRVKRVHWQFQTVKLRTLDKTVCSQWCNLINRTLQQLLTDIGCHRPKSLLVFVNPFGGTHKAERIHRQTVTPIFDIAGVQQKVVITEYQNHAKTFIETEDLSIYDGIIAVGGDGMLHEVVNGLLLRTQADKGIPIDKDKSTLDKQSKYVRPDVRVGVIPAGSTNCLSYVSQGIDDPETAALHIVLGDSHPLDVSSIYDRWGKFQKFSFSMTSFGFYGSVLNQSEGMRMLGPSRYDFAGVNAFLKQHAYPTEVWYLPSSDMKDHSVSDDTSRCRYPCKICCNETASAPKKNDSGLMNANRPVLKNSSIHPFATDKVNFNSLESAGLTSDDMHTVTAANTCVSVSNTASCEEETKEITDGGWQVMRGKFVMINSAVMSCACARCPQGLSPSAHLADGNTDLIFVRDCSKVDFFRYLFSHVGKANRFRFPFVDVRRVRAFRCFTAEEDSLKTNCTRSGGGDSVQRSGYWNTDGELLTDPNITLWVHKAMISLFARGVESD